MFRNPVVLAVAVTALVAGPALAQGLGHAFFMRGSIIGADTRGKVICLGKADGASEGQVLEVYRVTATTGPSKGVGVNFRA